MLTVFTGGARSGKSGAASRFAERAGAPVTLLATAQALDDEMRTRIDRHKADRPADWMVVEEPHDLDGATALAIATDSSATLIIDCLALWVTNRLAASDAEIIDEARRVAIRLAAHDGHGIVVTNEVGDGIVPENALARRFRDTLGLVNQVVVEHATDAYLCVAGRTLALHRPEEI